MTAPLLAKGLQLIAESIVSETIIESGGKPDQIIPAFSRVLARIGKLIPPPFHIRAESLSQEIADRRKTSVKAAHAWMLRPVLTRGTPLIIRRSAEAFLESEADRAVEQGRLFEIIEMARELRPGAFKSKIRAKTRGLKGG